ncbi:MAG: hypothetical protein GY774_04375 [Planctomycetes bacterium]|nr:hypothetical protein [Planctomycetota bacterium]
MAYKPTDADRKRVKDMMANGTTQADAAIVMGMAVKTLCKHFEYEITTAGIQANNKVAGWLFKNCENGNVTAQIFWLKTRARWRETDNLGLTEDDRIEKVEIVYKNGRKRK